MEKKMKRDLASVFLSARLFLLPRSDHHQDLPVSISNKPRLIIQDATVGLPGTVSPHSYQLIDPKHVCLTFQQHLPTTQQTHRRIPRRTRQQKFSIRVRWSMPECEQSSTRTRTKPRAGKT